MLITYTYIINNSEKCRKRELNIPKKERKKKSLGLECHWLRT